MPKPAFSSALKRLVKPAPQPETVPYQAWSGEPTAPPTDDPTLEQQKETVRALIQLHDEQVRLRREAEMKGAGRVIGSGL
jgi:hypothetical protein